MSIVAMVVSAVFVAVFAIAAFTFKHDDEE